jgi:Flp pilus assembly pilin Flp
MQHRATKLFVKYHDWQARRRLDKDEEGLSLVAYALGAAFIVVPMAIALFLFGQQASGRASTDLGTLLSASTPSLP